MSSSSFIRWCGLAASIAGLAYTGLLLLLLLQPYLLAPPLDVWAPVVLLVGVLAALPGIFALLRERGGWLTTVLFATTLIGATLLLVGAVAEALYGPAYSPAGELLVWGLLLATVGLLPLAVVVLRTRALPPRAAVALFIGAPPLAFFLFPLTGPAWALVGYALFREGSGR